MTSFPDRTSELPLFMSRPSNAFAMLQDPPGAFMVNCGSPSLAQAQWRKLRNAQSNPRTGLAQGWDASLMCVVRVGAFIYLMDTTNPDAAAYGEALVKLAAEDAAAETEKRRELRRMRRTATRRATGLREIRKR